ncbi:MAG: flavin reductase family protein [Bryobacterales bacterium]|nr:flavin reductase family protein [Bryobacterales bacterium]
MQLDPADFRRACARYATGVAVISIFDQANRPIGMTANSFTSISLHPPLVSFAIDQRATVLPHFRVAKTFAINILAQDQIDLSVRFATLDHDERFDDVEWHIGETGSPIIEGALAWLECTRWKSLEAGDHTLFVVKVRQAGVAAEGKPLLYFASSYQKLE